MFDTNTHRPSGRQHHDELRHEIRQRMREHHRAGRGNGPAALRDFLGRGRFGGPAMRRGEIRPLILGALAQKPMHGYEVIQALEEQSGGRWRPSAGSVYPTLQQLADEGLVTSQEVDGRRIYTLTDGGRTAAAASTTRAPWDETDGDQEPDIRQLAIQLMGATMQVQQLGSQGARKEARRLLTDVRRQMYRLLADDETESTADDDATPES